jgi:hypothetical protein
MLPWAVGSIMPSYTHIPSVQCGEGYWGARDSGEPAVDVEPVAAWGQLRKRP